MAIKLLLASTSKYRREQLARLGVPFESVDPQVDEAPFKDFGLPPAELAERLAEAKAAAVASQFSDAVVIGSDQLVSLEGEVLGKPGTKENAVNQLLRLSGKTHELITCVCIISKSKIKSHTEVAKLKMRALTREELSRYVDFDHPIDCAGSYKLESRGIALFESVDCRDHSSIIGLPMMAVTSRLREAGFEIP